jgi:hypothetical protein
VVAMLAVTLLLASRWGPSDALSLQGRTAPRAGAWASPHPERLRRLPACLRPGRGPALPPGRGGPGQRRHTAALQHARSSCGLCGPEARFLDMPSWH